MIRGAAACLVALVFASSAIAARPTPRGHYFGFPAKASEAASSVETTAELRVSKSGRRLASITVTAFCQSSAKVRLAGRRPAVPVHRDGRFAASWGDADTRYRVRGRFATPGVARLMYVQRDARSHRLACRFPMKLYRDGVPPFSGCRSQPAYTDLWADTGRVFQQYTMSPGRRYSTHLNVCLFETPSQRVDLGENYTPDDYRENFRLTAPFVAFFRHQCAMCIPWDQGWIEVRDARDGTLVRRPDITWGSRLADLELKGNGSVAWTLDRVAMGPDGFPIGYGTGQPPEAVAWEVWALDSHGHRLLDSGPNLDLHSLELNGSTLTWINDGTARTASLD